jgi:hypothetical protein
MAGIAFDFREAARGLLRHRSITALSLVCIALGVGTSAAMLGATSALVVLLAPPRELDLGAETRYLDPAVVLRAE